MNSDPLGTLAGSIAGVLEGSPFEHRSRWPFAVVVLTADERRVTSRGDFAGYLAANDLRAAARECTSRKIPPGSILVWLEVDAEDVAEARFLVIDLVSIAKRLSR